MRLDHRRRIVLIDDDQDLRRTVEQLLSRSGFDTVSTGDPFEALAVVKRTDPHLVLCDIEMPGMSGYDVLRELQSDPVAARYPVMFITAHQEFSERVRAFRFGVVDYVTKPFTRQILLRKVERVLQGLERRSGAISGSGGEARELIADLQREARTGVLTITGESGKARVVLQAGEAVEETGLVADQRELQAEFRELDRAREEIVTHEPSRLPGDAASVPSFSQLPEIFRSVLIVDDNHVFRKYLAELLSRTGLRVFEARDGEEALDLALRERPWLIVTDTRMPRMDGFELCRRVRNNSFIRHTPVVFLSGWDDYKDRYQALELGADEYLSKSYPVRELLIRMHLILSRFAQVGARGGQGMRGGLEPLGPAGLLQMCHLARLSGNCSVRSGSRLIEVSFRAGEIVSAESDRARGPEAVYELLSWTRGYFEFRPGDGGSDPPMGGFTELILEGCHRLDERRRHRGG